jgi:hypothetical protein
MCIIYSGYIIYVLYMYYLRSDDRLEYMYIFIYLFI